MVMRKSLYKPDNLITPLIKEALKVIPLKLFSRTLIFFSEIYLKTDRITQMKCEQLSSKPHPPRSAPKGCRT